MAKIHQHHFRYYSKRGQLSSGLMEDDDGHIDQICIFWNELGLDPQDEDEALSLISVNVPLIIQVAKDPNNPAVSKGVLKDPTEYPIWQKDIVRRRALKAGWDVIGKDIGPKER